jgi:hypothetical protein
MDPSIQAKPKLTPKDFVLYAGAMIALYVSVFSLLALLFQYINFAYRDALDYVDPYSTAMRISMATLIVFFPLLAWLTRVLNQDMRKYPEKRDLSFRKWILYITLLLAGITMAVDLVSLINTFLGGEITTRFVLKVVVVFLITGAVFLHYLADLWGYWEQNKRRSVSVGIGAGVLIVFSICAGFFLMGSPASQRLIRFDQQKVSDLQNIQWEITNYWQAKQALPSDLSVLNNPTTNTLVPTDPQSGHAYTYSIISESDHSFELCADFNRVGSDTYGPRSYPASGAESDSWSHGAGHICFTRTIDPAFFPPINKNAPTPTVAE